MQEQPGLFQIPCLFASRPSSEDPRGKVTNLFVAKRAKTRRNRRSRRFPDGVKIQAGVFAAHVTRTVFLSLSLSLSLFLPLFLSRDEWTKIILFRRWDVRNVLVSCDSVGLRLHEWERERERRPYQHVESPRLGSPTLDRTSSFDREDTYRGRDPIN